MDAIKRLFDAFVSSDTVERAAKTFVQAFVSTFALSVSAIDLYSLAAWKAAVVAAGAAAVSAVWNGVIKPWLP